ncbi:MFS transporter [Oxalobacter vibrioformis]|uniref:MFS transporter n=1 Tax=Oxalobacter vibrioformis TaxID=933080 RepID=A0A9E9LXT6_9BURK|nr:MFS transporter [Oxalobacter vibrioformis]WAW10256.1 MFS transporter [Oxalobacter vibrioformis]
MTFEERRENEQTGPFSPLSSKIFRMMWIATLCSNIGSWMQEVGAGWLMTSLAPDPLMVSLVQAATTIPFFLLAVPAGALADILDRRKYLIATQLWMAVSAAILGVLTLTGMTTAWTLLLLTFSLGIGAAMMMPAWGAIVPELVRRSELQSAIALNTIATNSARAIGPAIAGLIIAATGPGAVFVLNAISFFAVVIAIKKWNRSPRTSNLPQEQLRGAIRAGLRYARHSPELRAVLARGCAFFVFASAPWALLPLIVRQQLKSGPGTYGFMLACIGVGAICGALLLPRLYGRISRDRLVAITTFTYAAAMLGLAYSTRVYEAAPAMLVIGISWMTVFSSLMTSAQTALPSWVRARGLALYWVIYTSGFALGSVIWGQIASVIDIPTALAFAAIGAFVGILAAWRYEIGQHDVQDLSPSLDWSPPLEADTHAMDRGPIMVTIEYEIDVKRQREFVRALRHLKHVRQRNGAYLWEVLCDINRPGLIVEIFMVESLIEHLRQRERMTVADKMKRDIVREYHVGDAPPKITRLLGLTHRKRTRLR